MRSPMLRACLRTHPAQLYNRPRSSSWLKVCGVSTCRMLEALPVASI